jgi:hypothetical protein
LRRHGAARLALSCNIVAGRYADPDKQLSIVVLKNVYDAQVSRKRARLFKAGSFLDEAIVHLPRQAQDRREDA